MLSELHPVSKYVYSQGKDVELLRIDLSRIQQPVQDCLLLVLDRAKTLLHNLES